MANPRKVKQINLIIDLLTNSAHFIIIGYHQIRHQLLETIRKQLKQSNANLTVFKNTLFGKAVRRLKKNNQSVYKVIEGYLPLKQPSAIIHFHNDWLPGLKAFHTFLTKDANLQYRFGLLDSVFYPADQLETIAGLPDKRQLQAELVSRFKAPVVRVNYSIKFPVAKLLLILKNRR